MSIYSNIQALLDANLAAVAGLPTIQLENTRAIGKTGQSFSRGTLIPARSTPLSLGVDGADRYDGLYQVDIFVPQDTGTTASNGFVDAVLAQFSRGLRLGDDNFNILIGNAWREVASRNEPFYNVPVTVEWVYFKS